MPPPSPGTCGFSSRRSRGKRGRCSIGQWFRHRGAKQGAVSTPHWHGITLDRVDDVSDQVQLADDGAGNYRIAVPLALLGLDPRPGVRIKADIGNSARRRPADDPTRLLGEQGHRDRLRRSLRGRADAEVWGTWEFSEP
ncbi:MAG: hypothetical protein WDO13_08005 [Verrucomicrobiota bacterium]